MSIRDKVSPSDFRTDIPYMSCFDSSETENSAVVLVRFLQDRCKGWEPFTVEEIHAWKKKQWGDDIPPFIPNRLIGYWGGEYSPLVLTDGVYTIQDPFIARLCSNPQLVK